MHSDNSLNLCGLYDSEPDESELPPAEKKARTKKPRKRRRGNGWTRIKSKKKKQHFFHKEPSYIPKTQKRTGKRSENMSLDAFLSLLNLFMYAFQEDLKSLIMTIKILVRVPH